MILDQQDTSQFLTLNSNFHSFTNVVSRFNNLNLMKWKAGINSRFNNKTISQLNNMAGNRTHMRGHARAIPDTLDDLPANFNKWVEEGYTSKPKNQGGCGSC